ncbi:MAG: DNA-directed RNA polymerase subunit alpha C-terminal domain-containing protein [Anaerolineaceae bacterium]|nr:DNA-directed RNA polymerase subunit alpha C-terminal domain-containing protein [Anaerolineaceae bacterium]
MPIENLLRKLPAPAQRAIQSTGVKTVEELAQMSEKEMMSLHGFGPKGMKIIKEFLAENDLALKEK